MPSTRAELEAYARTGQLPLDPTVRIKLIEGYGKMQGLIEDYRKTHDAGMLKYRIAQLENSQRMLAANQRASNALVETKGKSARAAADALQARLTGLDNNMTQIATRTQQFSSRVFNPVEAAYNASAKDEEAKYSALIQLTREMGNQGVSYDSGAPELAVLGQQVLSMTGVMPKDQTLADLNTEAARAAVADKMGASPTQKAKALEFVNKAYAAFDQERVARDSIKKGKSEADRLIGIAMATNQPVSQDLADQIAKLNSDLDTTFANYAKQSLPEVQQQLQAAIAEDSEYQRLLSEADWYKSEYERMDPAMRKSKEVSLGRIVAQPIFQEWAKSNGLNIGTAVVNADGTVTYAPGGDDFKALMRFQYQMQHPDRFGERLFFDRGGSTGTVVEVTYTDPAERERQLARLAYDNGNLVGIESDGKMRYLTRQQYEDANENNGAEPTGYKHAKVGDKLYVKDPVGNISEVNPDGTTTYVGDKLEGATFGDAVIYKDGKPARYMTATDFNSPETLAVDGSLGAADQAESAELAKVSPFKRVPPDQAREIGSVTTIGTLDKMHANTIIKNGVGALSINGGQQVITPDMKPYVREIVHKDGAKLSDVGGVVRQVRAEQLAATYGANDPRSLAEQRAVAGTYYGQAPAQAGLTTAPLGTATATTAASARAGGQIPELSGLLQSAFAGPNPEAQVNQLERSDLVPSGTSAAVAESLAQAPATAPAAPSAAVTPAPAPAPVAAGAAVAAPAKPRITSNGYTYEIDVKPGQQATYTVVGVPPGVNMPQDRVIEPGDKRYAKFDENLRAEAEAAARSKTMTPVSELPGARTLPAVRGAEVKPTTLPVTADTQAKVQLLGAPAPTAPPAPSKVEGRGEGVELEERRGVLFEPTTKTRPTLESTIVGGLRGALREDAAGTEEPSLIEALKARREAKREEERAKMREEARAEAERQGERFEKQAATTARPAPSEGQAAMQRAVGLAMQDVAERERAGTITKARADAERQKLMRPTPLDLKPRPGAGSITGLMTSALSQPPTPKAAPSAATTPAATPASAPKPTAPAPKPSEPVETSDLSAFLPRKSMAEQVAPQGIGKPTPEPAAPRMPTPTLHEWDTEVSPTQAQPAKLDLARRALSGAKVPPQAPLGKKPEGAIPKAEPAAPSTATKPVPGVKYEPTARPPAATSLRDLETAAAGQPRMTAAGVGTNRGGPPPGPPRPAMTPPEAQADTLGPLGRYRAYAVSTGTKAEGEIPTAPAPTSPRAVPAPGAAKLDTSMATQPSREAQIREARLREIEARRREMQDALAAAKQNPARATVPELNAPAAIRR